MEEGHDHLLERRRAARDAEMKTAQPSSAPVVPAGGLGVPIPEGRGRGEGADWEVLRPYNPTSWFHPRGIYKVLARITPKSPNVEGHSFLTSFAFDPTLFKDAGPAFDLGRDRLVVWGDSSSTSGVAWSGRANGRSSMPRTA